MSRITQPHEHIVRCLLIGLLISGIFIGPVTAEPLSPQIHISGIQIQEITEDTAADEDDREITDVSGLDALPFWRQILITRLSLSFEDTPLHVLIQIAAPFIFVLLGIFCAARFQSAKQQRKSTAPRRILTYIQENPGCSQKQLVAVLRISRGSVCYHLHKLKTAEKLIQVSQNGSTLYYPAGTKAGEQFEQTLFQLLTRKKSGKFLQVLYEHPHASRGELAGFLDLSPETLRWYLRRYAAENIVFAEWIETEYHYSFTPRAREVYEYLRQAGEQESDAAGQRERNVSSHDMR